MKTAEEHFKEFFKVGGYSNQWDLYKWGIAFAEYVRDEDRKIVAENAVAISCQGGLDHWSEIDQDSIINAPKSELK